MKFVAIILLATVSTGTYADTKKDPGRRKPAHSGDCEPCIQLLYRLDQCASATSSSGCLESLIHPAVSSLAKAKFVGWLKGKNSGNLAVEACPTGDWKVIAASEDSPSTRVLCFPTTDPLGTQKTGHLYFEPITRGEARISDIRLF